MKISFAYDFQVCVIEFKDKIQMKECLEQYATDYEGSIEKRIGYNFEIPTNFHLKMFTKNAKYIISYVSGDTCTKIHEMLHAKYFLSEKYKQEIQILWSSFSEDDQNKIINVLCCLGYPKQIQLDEFQAFWFSERNPKRFFGI